MFVFLTFYEKLSLSCLLYRRFFLTFDQSYVVDVLGGRIYCLSLCLLMSW